LAIAGISAGAIVAALLLQGPLLDVRGSVDVPYPAGEVKELRVLGLSLKVDGEPRPGASVLGAIALFMLATACFMTFGALRLAGAQRRLGWFWLIASGGLAVAATDELLAVHESIGHNLPFLADLPGVKRPDDLLILLYLPGALAFAWWFRDVLREHRMTLWCMTAAIVCFALSAASDLASLRLEEWFELVAGLFVATGLVALMHRHLTRNLQIRVRVTGPPAERGQPLPARPGRPQPSVGHRRSL
jgi:hypothetical protein